MSDEKTEQPTSHKLEKAREKGQTHQSQDANAAATLTALILCFLAAATMSIEHLTQLTRLALDLGLAVRDDAQMQTLAIEMAKHGTLMALPFLVTCIVVATVTSMAQVGIEVSFEPLKLNFSKLNPAAGLKKIFSVRSLIDFVKMLIKAIFLATVITLLIRSLLPLLIGSSLQTPATLVSVAWSALLKLLAATVLVFLVISPLDYGLQRWLFIREQRMSKDEVKREYKDMEGDPLIKGMRRQLAHELANSAPQQRVPHATVVVTNPTHFAVALRFVAGVTPLPIIVAKGADEHALLIRELARQHAVPIVGNPPLARALFSVPLDNTVPESLFEAVATVLRWVNTVDHLGQAVAHGLGESPALQVNDK